MNYKVLAGLFSILISSIAALNVIDFPMDFRVAPGNEMAVKLSGNDIAAGDRVRVELWDNQDDEDINAAVLGEELKVQADGTIRLDVPADFPKTNNAFLRIYYKCHNAVTPRFSIKAHKNCMQTKVPHKPTETPTPIVIFKPIINVTPTPTPIIIHSPEASVIHAGPISASAGDAQVDGVVAPIIATPVRHSSIKSSVTIKSTSSASASSSTSSASVAKISAGSIAVAMAVAFAMLF